MQHFAMTPEPPCSAVIFTSLRHDAADDYSAVLRSMQELATAQPGFPGPEPEPARGAGRFGITVSYRAGEEAVAAWTSHAERVFAQARAGERYAGFRVRLARVERAGACRGAAS